MNIKSALLDVMNCTHPRKDICLKLGRHVWGSTLALYLNNPEMRALWEAEAPFRKGEATANMAQPGERTVPCRFKLNVLAYCTKRPGGQYDEFVCELHDRCTPRYVSGLVKACCLCPDYQAGEVPMEWIATEDLVRDTIRFAGSLPQNLAGVAGVPRSGMLPASILATQLHLPLLECSTEQGFKLLGKGGRGYVKLPLDNPILVVDDTVYMGSQFARLDPVLQGRNVIRAAIYVHQGSTSKVDRFYREVPWMSQFEWNVTNNQTMPGFGSRPGWKGGIGVDLDGVLCHDADSGGKPGELHMTMRAWAAPLICTGRSERLREYTILQLKHWGAQYQALEMRPLGVDDTPAAIANLKATKAVKYQLGAFIESDEWQAKEIADLSGIPVICPRLRKVFQRSASEPLPKLQQAHRNRR